MLNIPPSHRRAFSLSRKEIRLQLYLKPITLLSKLFKAFKNQRSPQEYGHFCVAIF